MDFFQTTLDVLCEKISYFATSETKASRESIAKNKKRSYCLTTMNVFITGYPGFIGRRLVLNLTKKFPDCRLHLLVHPSQEKNFKKKYLKKFFTNPKKTFIYKG